MLYFNGHGFGDIKFKNDWTELNIFKRILNSARTRYPTWTMSWAKAIGS